MKRLLILLGIVLLCLTSACSYSVNKKSTPLSAEYHRTAKAGTRTATLTLVLSQGKFNLSDSRQGMLWSGTYESNGDQLTFTGDQSGRVGKTICPAPDPYTYQWSYDETSKQMTFTKGNDLCAFRVVEMTDGVWTQQTAEPTPIK